MNKISSILIGTDPEAFLQDKETGEIVSAIPYIPGSKHKPYPLEKLGQGYYIQTDNVMVEWCVPAVDNPEELFNSIQKVIGYTNDVIPGNLHTAVISSARLHKKYLNNEQAMTFGCDPDYNAWALCVNNSPSSKTNLRTAGGHIHVGYDNPNDDTSLALIRALDLFLGVPSIILDKDTERRKMYGKAGAFRMKSYGVEYRSLSNFWIDDPELVKMVFDGVNKAADFVNFQQQFSDEDQLNIQNCINSNDTELAVKLISKYHIEEILPIAITV